MKRQFAQFVLAMGMLAIVSVSVAAPKETTAPARATVEKISVPVEVERYFAELNRSIPQNTGNVTTAMPIDWGAIVNIGQQIWDFILKSGGTMEGIPTIKAGAVPAGISSFAEMSGWRMGNVEGRRLSIPGQVFGEAFVMEYFVGFSHSGSYRGKGNYLANVTVLSRKSKCGWSHGCEVKIEVQDALNSGTDENPIAMLPVVISVKDHGKVNTKVISTQFVVYGNGKFEQHDQSERQAPGAGNGGGGGYYDDED